MEVKDLSQTRVFDGKAIKRFLIHDSAAFRILNFNISAGQVFPVHSHGVDGQLSMQVLEGSGAFLGADDTAVPAKAGDIFIADISEPHGMRAETDMRILVTIAPPI